MDDERETEPSPWNAFPCYCSGLPVVVLLRAAGKFTVGLRKCDTRGLEESNNKRSKKKQPHWKRFPLCVFDTGNQRNDT